MIWNIVDRRKRIYRWKAITAIVEPTCHDNTCKDSDQAEHAIKGMDYDAKPEISVSEAVTWAHALAYPVTLYLYDLGRGINVLSAQETDHFTRSNERM
jgi:hypothetical protein